MPALSSPPPPAQAEEALSSGSLESTSLADMTVKLDEIQEQVGLLRPG